MQHSAPRWLRLASGALLVVLMIACMVMAWPSAAGAADGETEPRWAVPGTPPARDRWGGCDPVSPRRKEFFPVDLPEARHAAGLYEDYAMPRHWKPLADRPRAAEPKRYLTLNMAVGGEVYVGSYSFDLLDPEPGARFDARRALAEALQQRAAADRGRGWTAVRLTLDREVKWHEARLGLWVVLQPGVGIPALEISVRGDDRFLDRGMQLRMRWSTREDRSQPVRLTAVRVGAEGLRRTEVRHGKRVFAFPPGDRFRDADFVREANATWAALAQHIADASAGPVILELDGGLDVPWAYVVGILDVLADAGVERVVLPSAGAEESDERPADLTPFPPQKPAGIVLEFEPLPGPLPVPDCGPISREGPSWWVLVLVALAAAGFAVWSARTR